jgi:hypothetical protein
LILPLIRHSLQDNEEKGITANDLGGTDRFEITSISGTGFNIKFLNAGNAVQDKTFSYTAVGFGRGS